MCPLLDKRPMTQKWHVLKPETVKRNDQKNRKETKGKRGKEMTQNTVKYEKHWLYIYSAKTVAHVFSRPLEL